MYAADCLLKLCFEMPKLTVERITTLPATPNGVQCNCALCDGHIMKMSRSATVAIPPRKYARIDPAGKRHNTLGEYTIIMACGTYGTNIRAPFDNSYTVLEDVKCDVPVGLPSTIADRYSGKRSGLRNMCKMRSINACRMPSLSDPTLDARSCALPDILRSCLTVDGRPIKIGDKVLFTRQPTESYESIVVLTVVRFIDCPCLCINTNVLDTVLRGDDDGDDLNAFPLTRLASKDEDLVAIPARVNVANRDAVFMTVNDFRSIYAAPDSGYLGSGILRLIEFGILSHTQVDAFRSSKYNKCEQITVGSSNRCVFQSMQPHRQDHVGSLENIVHVATSDSLKGVVGENTRLLRNNLAPLQINGREVLWNGTIIGTVDNSNTGMASKWVGLRLALRFGRMAQGELMSRHKLFAQGLQPSNVLNMMLGIQQGSGYNDTLVFNVTRWSWIPNTAKSKAVNKYLQSVRVIDMPNDLSWIRIANGLKVAAVVKSRKVNPPEGSTFCKITTGMTNMPRWGVLAAMYTCFEMTSIEFQCLAMAVLSGNFPVDVRESNVSWTHMASAYPKRLLNNELGDNIGKTSDTRYDLTAAKLLRRWS